jgi:AbiJ N-terminal domain 4
LGQRENLVRPPETAARPIHLPAEQVTPSLPLVSVPVSFSERYGYKPVREVVQHEAINAELLTGLWNVLDIFFWEGRRGQWTSVTHPKNIAPLLWMSYFKEPLDTIPNHWDEVIPVIRSYFFRQATWHEVYDFIEFMARVDPEVSDAFQDACNHMLEREMSAYRFVDGRITEITSEPEIAEIEGALSAAPGTLPGVQTHLRAALEHLSDRATPDYRNSIKESISAVESAANAVAGTTGETLGAILRQLQPTLDLHPALEGAFSKMYGYTSDAQGIRHALMEEPSLSAEDAKFMLVACSAFVNYLIAKAAKAGIAL